MSRNFDIFYMVSRVLGIVPFQKALVHFFSAFSCSDGIFYVFKGSQAIGFSPERDLGPPFLGAAAPIYPGVSAGQSNYLLHLQAGRINAIIGV